MSTIAAHQLCYNCIDWKNISENHQLLEHPKSSLQDRDKRTVRFPVALWQPATLSPGSGRVGRKVHMTTHYLCISVLWGLWEAMGLFWLWAVTLELMNTVAKSMYILQHHIRKHHNNYWICLNHPVSIAWESYSVCEKTEKCISPESQHPEFHITAEKKQHTSFIQKRTTLRGKLARDTSRGP